MWPAEQGRGFTAALTLLSDRRREKLLKTKLGCWFVFFAVIEYKHITIVEK